MTIPSRCTRCGSAMISVERDVKFNILIGGCVECGKQYYDEPPNKTREKPVPANSLKDRCPQGHPYDDANTYWYTNPNTGRTFRVCRTCKRLRQRKQVTGKEAA